MKSAKNYLFFSTLTWLMRGLQTPGCALGPNIVITVTQELLGSCNGTKGLRRVF